MQAIDTFGAEALDPFSHRLRRRVEPESRGSLAQPVIHHGAHHLLSTFRCEASILVHVHSVPRESLRFGNVSVPRTGPNGQPPESSQLATMCAHQRGNCSLLFCGNATLNSESRRSILKFSAIWRSAAKAAPRTQAGPRTGQAARQRPAAQRISSNGRRTWSTIAA